VGSSFRTMGHFHTLVIKLQLTSISVMKIIRIGHHGPIPRLLRSPDTTPLDFFLWGLMPTGPKCTRERKSCIGIRMLLLTYENTPK
jgi:hypothetical protein